jgi:hypothetical protein
MNAPLIVFDSLSANCADFIDFGVLPGDELNDGVTIVGVRDGTVYGLNAVGDIIPVNLSSKIRVRHVWAVCKQGDRYVSTFNCLAAPQANGH